MARASDVFSFIFNNNRAAMLLGCGIVALGIGLGGGAIGSGMVRMKRADREVTVRGVAQRDVKADRANWHVTYAEHAYDLAGALAAVDRDSAKVQAYLKGQGFAGAQTRPGSADVSEDDERIDNKPTGRTIYTVKRSIAFTTGDVAGVERVQANKDQLAQQGLVVDGVGANYEYTRLDQIKPDMIAEATKDARGAAEKFANDSNSSVGDIRSATQGYFSVSDRDHAESSGGGDEDNNGGGSSQTASSPDQRVRVVTTIDYYLN